MKKPEIRPIAAACMVLAILAAILAIAAINQRIVSSRLSSQVAGQKRELAELTRDTASRQALAKNYEELSSRIGGRFREVTWDKQMPKMVNQLTGIMNAHEIAIETLKPEAITSSDSISRLPLRVSFKCSLGHLARALRDIQRATPLMDIEQISIRVADAKSNELQADAVVSSFAVVDKNLPDKTRLPGGSRRSPVAAQAKTIPGAPEVSITPVDETNASRGAL